MASDFYSNSFTALIGGSWSGWLWYDGIWNGIWNGFWLFIYDYIMGSNCVDGYIFHRCSSNKKDEDTSTILKKRYASGKITKKQYEEMKKEFN